MHRCDLGFWGLDAGTGPKFENLDLLDRAASHARSYIYILRAPTAMPPRKRAASKKAAPEQEDEKGASPSPAGEHSSPSPSSPSSPSSSAVEKELQAIFADAFSDGRECTAEECIAVLREKMQRLQALEADAVHLRSQVTQNVIANAYLTRKDVQLQDEFERLRSLTEPGLLQLKQLIAEPAVNREFMRLASLAKSSSLEAQRLKDEIRGLHFGTNNPKGASSLLSQIKGLEGKVRALSAEGMESKVTALEASLKLAEAKVSELSRKVYALEDKNKVLVGDKDALERELLGYRGVSHPRSGGGRDGGPTKRGRRAR